MKSPTNRTLITPGLLLAAALLMAQSAFAQTWSTGFFNKNNGYAPALYSLDGAPTNVPASQQWQTTDDYDPVTGYGATSQMQYFNGWTLGLSAAGNQSVLFGGYNADVASVLPGIPNPVLYRDFDHTFGTAATTFSVDFGIIGPSPDLSGAYTNNDIFGFNLASSGGASLAAFQLNPTGALPGFLRFDWIQNGAAVVTNGTTFSGFQIEYGALYRLTATLSNNTVTMDVAGLTAQNGGPGIGITNFSAGPATTVVNGGAISGSLTSSDFETVEITWDLASGNNLDPGANYMVINTVSVVPEPSTIGLFALGLGVVGATYLRRRRS